MTAMLSESHRLPFEHDGICKLEGSFSCRDAERLGDVMWNELRHRYGIEHADPSTWNLHPPTGMKSSRKSRAFEPILGPIVVTPSKTLSGQTAGCDRRSSETC